MNMYILKNMLPDIKGYPRWKVYLNKNISMTNYAKYISEI